MFYALSRHDSINALRRSKSRRTKNKNKQLIDYQNDSENACEKNIF